MWKHIKDKTKTKPQSQQRTRFFGKHDFFFPLFFLFPLFRNIPRSSGTSEARRIWRKICPWAESIWHALSYCYSSHRATALVLLLPAQYNPSLLHLTLTCKHESNLAACKTELALGIINLPLLTPAGSQAAVGARSLSCRQSPTEKIARRFPVLSLRKERRTEAVCFRRQTQGNK